MAAALCNGNAAFFVLYFCDETAFTKMLVQNNDTKTSQLNLGQ